YQRGWKHRIAVGVIMMPWYFACFLPPPRLQMITEASINKSISGKVADFWRLVVCPSGTRNQTPSAGLTSFIKSRPSAAEPAVASPQWRKRRNAHPQNGNHNYPHFHPPGSLHRTDIRRCKKAFTFKR